MGRLVLFLLISVMVVSTKPIYDFSANSNLQVWFVVNDGVMGGLSTSTLKLNEEGHGVFAGTVSLENNGGFCSLRHRFERMNVRPYSTLKMRIKGDDKKYQFRVKTNSSDYYSYVYDFQTTSEWAEVKIPLKEMQPAFRGRNLNLPDFPGESMEEIGILIGNKKAEDFSLLIDYILLE